MCCQVMAGLARVANSCFGRPLQKNYPAVRKTSMVSPQLPESPPTGAEAGRYRALQPATCHPTVLMPGT